MSLLGPVVGNIKPVLQVSVILFTTVQPHKQRSSIVGLFGVKGRPFPRNFSFLTKCMTEQMDG